MCFVQNSSLSDFSVFLTESHYQKPRQGSNNHEIITLKITLKIFVTLKRHGNHTEKYLQRKSQGIIQDNHTKIFSFVVQRH